MSKEYKKFGEITRDEQLELINHVLDGGDVEINSESHSSEGWCKTEMPKLGCLCFCNSHFYRKVKTELEVLKEEYEKIGKKIEELEDADHSIKIGDQVRYRNSTYTKPYEVIEAYLYPSHPYIVDGCFFNKESLNRVFIKVS